MFYSSIEAALSEAMKKAKEAPATPKDNTVRRTVKKGTNARKTP